MNTEGWSFPVDSERVHYFRVDSRTDAQRIAAARRRGASRDIHVGSPQQRSLCGLRGIDSTTDPWERSLEKLLDYDGLGMLCGMFKRQALKRTKAPQVSIR